MIISGVKGGGDPIIYKYQKVQEIIEITPWPYIIH
jgi:hypothetical protein